MKISSAFFSTIIMAMFVNIAFAGELAPRMLVDGAIGDNNSAAIDIMLPVIGDNKQLLHFDTMAHYQEHTGNLIFSNGLGVRKTVANDTIIGGYLFADYNNYKDSAYQFAAHHDFWVLNPGLEYLGDDWDFALNGYFPLSKKKWLLHDGWADEFGDYRYTRFIDHSMYNKHLQEYANLGTGVDLIIGSVMPAIPRLKAYIGTYYFEANCNPNLFGIFGRVIFALNNHSEILSDYIYDEKMHNTVLFGIRLKFGGADKGRIMDPVQHNFLKGNYGLSVPMVVSKNYYAASDSGFDLEMNNIQFFSGNNALNYGVQVRDGSYEHPYLADDFTQARVNASGEGANFFIAQNTNIDIGSQIVFMKNQSVYGRSADFIERASDLNRPQFFGSMKITDGDRLDSIHLQNNSLSEVGVAVVGSNNGTAVLDNVSIGDENNREARYKFGISIADFGMVSINNSAIYAHNNWSGGKSYGIMAKNSAINIIDSTVFSDADKVELGADSAESYGVYADKSIVNIENSAIKSRSANSAYGIYAENAAQINISGAKTVIFGEATDLGMGIYAANSTVAVKSSLISGKGIGEKSLGYGIVAVERSAIDISDANIMANGLEMAYGVRAENSFVQIADSVIAAEANAGAYSIFGASSERLEGSLIRIIGTNNLFRAHNLTDHGDAYGIYLLETSKIVGDYQHNNYEISGGEHSGKWNV